MTYDMAKNQGIALWFTGLSGAGKTTIAEIVKELLEKERPVTLLDGDVVRKNSTKKLGFSQEDRHENVCRVGDIAGTLTSYGGVVVCSLIAPYKESRLRNRAHIGKQGTYVEIYVATPLSECRKRDPKGLYRKVDSGEIRNFTGVDDPYEVPQNPEIVLDTVGKTPEECAEEVLYYINQNNLL